MRSCIKRISNPITAKVRNRHFFHWVSTSDELQCKVHIRGLVLPILLQGMGVWSDCPQFSKTFVQTASHWSYSVFELTLGENVLYPHLADEETVELSDSPMVTMVRLTVVKPGCKTRKAYSRPQALNHKCSWPLQLPPGPHPHTENTHTEAGNALTSKHYLRMWWSTWSRRR